MSRNSITAIAAVAILGALAAFLYQPQALTAAVFAIVVLVATGGVLLHLKHHRPDALEQDKKLP